MTLKKFGILSSVIAVIIITIIITLSCVKVNNGLELENPTTILVYAKSSQAITVEKDNRPSDYKKFVKGYREMTNLTILDYTAQGISLNNQPSQDIDQVYPQWSNNNKTNYYCIELVYEDKQSVVVNINGNTKVIEFYSLIMQLEESKNGQEAAIYFAKSSNKSYSLSPITVRAKQNNLIQLIKDLSAKINAQ